MKVNNFFLRSVLLEHVITNIAHKYIFVCVCIVRMCVGHLHLIFSRLILFSATRVVPVKAKGTFVFSKTSTFSEKKRKPVKAICSKNNATLDTQ